MLAALTMARLPQDLATLSRALSFPTLHPPSTIAALEAVITTDCRPRWIRDIPTASHTGWHTPFHRPYMLEATGFTVSKVAFRQTPMTRLASIGLSQGLI